MSKNRNRINLRVWLIIPDAEAATVKNTLIRRLGYGDILADVKKERLFSIDVDSGDPQELAKAFAKELVNENKEGHKVLFDEPQVRRRLCAGEGCPAYRGRRGHIHEGQAKEQIGI